MLSSDGKHDDSDIKNLATMMQDVLTLVSTSNGKISPREAYKTVFGEDKPELDPDTPQGMRQLNQLREDGWFINEK